MEDVFNDNGQPFERKFATEADLFYIKRRKTAYCLKQWKVIGTLGAIAPLINMFRKGPVNGNSLGFIMHPLGNRISTTPLYTLIFL